MPWMEFAIRLTTAVRDDVGVMHGCELPRIVGSTRNRCAHKRQMPPLETLVLAAQAGRDFIKREYWCGSFVLTNS